MDLITIPRKSVDDYRSAFQWLKRFNAVIPSTPGRKVGLLFDICSAHGTASNLPSLSNVEMIFLPPNTTSNIQPMDAGIIAAMEKSNRQ